MNALREEVPPCRVALGQPASTWHGEHFTADGADVFLDLRLEVALEQALLRTAIGVEKKDPRVPGLSRADVAGVGRRALTQRRHDSHPRRRGSGARVVDQDQLISLARTKLGQRPACPDSSTGVARERHDHAHRGAIHCHKRPSSCSWANPVR